MKKKLFLFIFLILSIFNITSVNASTKTFERTNEDLRVPDYINVTEDNKSNILLTPSVDAKEKVYDFADLFDDNQEKELFKSINKYIEATNMDLAVVTISYNNKHNASVYSDDFYDYNDFGIGPNNSGLLFLIDMDTREIYFTTTGDAIAVYTDYRKNAILDKVFRYMSDERYYEGTNIFINAILSYSSIESSSDSNYTINNDGMLVKDNSFLIGVFIFALIGTIVIILIMAYLNKTVHKANSSRSYLNNSTMRVNKVRDLFVGSHVSKVSLPSDSSSGIGGSSTHSGSSGISHGGGGHKF